jgi:NADH-quinone oxidoreductase subunit J
VSSLGTVFFAIAAGIAVLSAFGAIASRTPIRSAMCLLAHIISLAGLYLTLHAHLLAAVQLIVYAGAVVVLFVFVIMLIGPTEEPRAPGLTGATPRVLSIFLMASVALSVASAVGGHMPAAPEIKGCEPGVVECGEFGGVKGVARVLYKDAAIPFELVSVLLLVAILGAIVVARGRSQHEQAKHKADRAARDAADAAQREYEQKLSAEVSAHGGHG